MTGEIFVRFSTYNGRKNFLVIRRNTFQAPAIFYSETTYKTRQHAWFIFLINPKNNSENNAALSKFRAQYCSYAALWGYCLNPG